MQFRRGVWHRRHQAGARALSPRVGARSPSGGGVAPQVRARTEGRMLTGLRFFSIATADSESDRDVKELHEEDLRAPRLKIIIVGAGRVVSLLELVVAQGF